MSITISALCFPNPSLKRAQYVFSLPSQTRLCSRTRNRAISFLSSSIQRPSFTTEYYQNLLHFSSSRLGYSVGRKLGFRASAENGEGVNKRVVDEAEAEARGQSTMPERFRPLTKEVPSPPVRWPWFVALAFLLYAWRTVLWELSNWRKVVASIFQFLGYLLKLALALIFHFIGDPITSLIRGIETTLYTIQASYSAVVSHTPVPELTLIIILVSAIFAIAEAAVPDSVESQPYLLTVSGLIGFAAVKGVIIEFFFWILLIGLFAFARFIKKRDYVSSLLPVVSVLAAVGEPWVRFVAMTSYLALAIYHHWKKPLQDKDGSETVITGRKIPPPLLVAALAIGIRCAAKWAGYRHLTWMIV
ncbi:hypothetical protein NMG60_11003035 [Bertholletia excelsa]